MIQKNNIDQRVQRTLDSLDGIQRASAGPFFYTRLKAKLEQGEKSVWETISSFISRPSMVFTTICVVLLLNMIVLFRKQPTAITSTPEDQNEQTLNNAYDVASSTNTTILNIWNQDNEQHIQK